ncbi:MAG: hypothetical protein [Olavius algarvensis Gamma 1 endosymbiont]|nr:MAG: hypothetical protein [Olavius algarvensis Gamma 1 endosymbiont]
MKENDSGKLVVSPPEMKVGAIDERILIDHLRQVEHREPV